MDLSGRTDLLAIVLASVAFFLVISGLRALRLGSRTIYFRHRRQRVLAGWWMTGAGLALGVTAFLILRAGGLPLAPAAPTPAPAAKTATAAPSQTFTPAPTPSRAAAFTASGTPTPRLPLSLEIMVVSSVTPQVSAAISDIRFSDTLVDGYPIGRRFDWVNPLRRMYATFSYSHMTYGAQFTALWFRNGELIFFESGPWQAGGRGLSHSKWEPAPHEWHPGEYEVQFFVGTEWKATGRFTVTGEPRPPTPTRTPSPTRTSSPFPSETPTATPTQ